MFEIVRSSDGEQLRGGTNVVKEIVDPNFFVKIGCEAAIDERLFEFLPGSYLLSLNNVLNIVLLPWLGNDPWPPRFPEAFDAYAKRDEAARYVLVTEEVVVAPHPGTAVRVEHLEFPAWSEIVHNVFWLPDAQHVALRDEVERLFQKPRTGLSLRLSELGNGPCAAFLRDILPRAKLGEFVERALCFNNSGEP